MTTEQFFFEGCYNNISRSGAVGIRQRRIITRYEQQSNIYSLYFEIKEV